MPVHENLQQIHEHQIYKTVAPLVSIALVGCVTWLLTMILDLENKALSNEQKIVHYQQDAEDAWEEIEDLRRTVIDLRIYLGNGYRSSPHD